MKLVKSLLLSSAVGLTAVASAQAADLPFRKAAPVEYVRVCDFTGAGYFYIPGTDTCLKVGGYLRADFAWIEPTNVFFASVNPAGAVVPGVGVTGRGTASGTIVASANRAATGFRAEGRIDADARTQTAYGTLRTYVRFQADAAGGNFTQNPAGAAISPASSSVGSVTGISSTANTAYVDKGFIQFAGFTAGRVQSFFDFYADNYNFEGIANSDVSNEVFAYTATFGGGFSATIAAEDATTRRDGIRNTVNQFGATDVNYGGEQIPDFVGVIRLDQAWGAAQLSAAYHQVNAVETGALTPSINGTTREGDKDGFAIQAAVQIKLPMLAAGDDIWLEGAYEQGATLYYDSVGNLNSGFNSLAVGGFVHQDADAISFRNANGSYSVSLSEGFSVMGALHHYFTPTFSDVLFGSYQEVSYGNRAKNLDWTLGGLGDASQYRVGNQFIWTPVNNLSIGLEFDYMHIDQTLGHNPGTLATALPTGIKKDPSAFEGRLRMERDF